MLQYSVVDDVPVDEIVVDGYYDECECCECSVEEEEVVERDELHDESRQCDWWCHCNNDEREMQEVQDVLVEYVGSSPDENDAEIESESECDL